MAPLAPLCEKPLLLPAGRHVALDIAPEFGIMKAGSNDVAISQEKEPGFFGDIGMSDTTPPLPTVYIETSIVSYLVARLTANLLSAACQQVTAEWWEGRRHLYDLFTSELVIAEAKAGDADAAARRLELLRGIPELTISDDVKRLALAFIAQGALPDKAQPDAIHIAVAAVHKLDYLLTWNCRHIDNPATKPAVRAVCTSEGYRCPEICTPIEMMEAISDER